MPIYSADHRGGLIRRRFERSPIVALETDAASIEALPNQVRSVADSVLLESLESLRAGTAPPGADGVVTWLAGDSLLEGSAAEIRHDLRTPGRRSFIPVHLPCMDEMPLITIQPRWFRTGRPHGYFNFAIRVSSSAVGSPQVRQVLKASAEPWAKLSEGLFAEQETPGAGVAALLQMWEQGKQLPPMFRALVLRNLVVLMARHKEYAKDEELLQAGMKAFPGYAELPYIGALLCFRQNRAAQALALLERAKSREAAFLGCGGESSYRVAWLMGLLAVRVGNQRVAFDRFREGMICDPVFVPAVEELLKLRLPSSLIESNQWEFCRVARREPQLLEKIFEFLLLHRAHAAARRLIETIPLESNLKIHLQERLESATTPFRPIPTPRGAKLGVIVSGPFFEHTSLGRVNREVAGALLKSSDLEVCIEPSSCAALTPQMVANGDRLGPALLKHPVHLDLTIRHQWPPDFRRPPRGKLAVVLPWEYGAVPAVWVREIEKNADELWVPSRFVRDVFVRSGVRATQVEVIPNGFDPGVFAPEGPTSRPQSCRKFMFLFVGGAIRRKGVDLLLEAYNAAFDPGEEVSLVLSVSGSTGAYQHNSLVQQIQETASDPRSPQVHVLVDSFDDATLASLYRGCDAFVLPYRGEGFGMPLLEAMACGKPVITTARGPSQDFCTDQTSYLVSAREEAVPDDPPSLGEVVGEFTWFEPDFAELVRTLRRVYDHPEEAAQRGRAAAKFVHQKYTWSRVTRHYLDRVSEMIGFQSSVGSARS